MDTNWDLLTEDDIDMAYAATAEYVKCEKCEVEMPLDQGSAAPGGGYLCPFDTPTSPLYGKG